jgi:hypothetical protein
VDRNQTLQIGNRVHFAHQSSVYIFERICRTPTWKACYLLVERESLERGEKTGRSTEAEHSRTPYISIQQRVEMKAEEKYAGQQSEGMEGAE